ncbi:MAG: HEAT repeat domain-containing protein [Planctomycetota bacterium]|jgi:hypothetical protein
MRSLCPVLMVLMTVLAPVLAEDGAVHRARTDQLLAALTDHRRSIYEGAISGLGRVGPAAIPDLAILAGDPDAQIRARVALALSAIGGRATFPLLTQLVEDRSDYVREVAALALGRSGHEQAYLLLAPLIHDPMPAVRESSALALGLLDDRRALTDLALWPDAGGRLDLLHLSAGAEGERQLERIRAAMRASLRSLSLSADGVSTIVAILPGMDLTRQLALVEQTWEIGDPRLSPILADLLTDGNVELRRLAAEALAANGDGRCLAALTTAAAEDPSVVVRQAAARSLRVLTGHGAGAGQAWQLWWRDHAQRVAALAESDALIASWYDPATAIDRAALARHQPQMLMALVDGVLGNGPPWWSARAWDILRQDDASRWTTALAERYRDAGERERVGLVVLLDELADPSARDHLRGWFDDVRAVRGQQPHAQRSLYAALSLAVLGRADGPIR